jgi:hypothetical protein
LEKGRREQAAKSRVGEEGRGRKEEGGTYESEVTAARRRGQWMHEREQGFRRRKGEGRWREEESEAVGREESGRRGEVEKGEAIEDIRRRGGGGRGGMPTCRGQAGCSEEEGMGERRCASGERGEGHG